MDSPLVARNDATRVNNNFLNGRFADIHITPRGSDWYWTVCSVMGLSSLIFMALSLRKPRQERIFYYITSAVVITAFIAYFVMGSNLGWAPIRPEWRRSDPKVRGVYREVFYVRYIDWFITTPLLLLDLMLTAGMPWPTILWVIFMDWVMIITGLVGALIQSRYKWGLFAFGCAALLYIMYQLGWEARRHANGVGQDVGRVFTMCGSLTLFLWILYPIAWGVSEGGNVIAPDSEAIFYGVLDLLAKPVFGALLLWGHRNIDPGRLGLRIRDYDEDPAVHGGIGGANREKLNHPHPNGTQSGGEYTSGQTNGQHPATVPGSTGATAATNV